MSLVADLFFSSDTQRETLHRRITPTDEQFDQQKERWNDLASFLKTRLKEDTGLSTRTWLQGSYKFDTQIRPWSIDAEFDIDLGFYFEWEGKPKDGDFEPEALKAFVQSALEDYADDGENDSTGVEDPKERCCRITFNPDFHIDVPCYHLDPDRDARALATETLGWESSDPKAIYKWFKELYEDAWCRSQLRRQVRYLKMWAALNFPAEGRPSSILLTVLAAEALEGYSISDETDDAILEHIAVKVRQRLGDSGQVPNPIDKAEDLNRLDADQTLSFVQKLEELVDIASRARDAGDKGSACEIWSEAFGQFFPMPEDNEDEEDVAKSTGSRGALVLFRFDPKVFVEAIPRANKSRNWTGVNELPVIPKDCDITFTLMNQSELPVGATLRWMVRNRGNEAATLNDLGHPAGDQVQVTEHSAYNGDHAMDLSVYLGSQIVGRRRIWVKVRGAAMPARQRPSRRQFRRR